MPTHASIERRSALETSLVSASPLICTRVTRLRGKTCAMVVWIFRPLASRSLWMLAGPARKGGELSSTLTCPPFARAQAQSPMSSTPASASANEAPAITPASSSPQLSRIRQCTSITLRGSRASKMVGASAWCSAWQRRRSSASVLRSAASTERNRRANGANCTVHSSVPGAAISSSSLEPSVSEATY